MRSLPLLTLSTLTFFAALAPTLGGCGGSSGDSTGRTQGQTEFSSAPPANQGGSFGANGGASDSASVPAAVGSKGATSTGDVNLGRSIEETDLYRQEGDRLYYLNSYRGLMVFDITNVDAPVLLGRAPIFGTPVQMFVQNGIATVVIGDWYGNAPDGTPFHGSVVRALDANDPNNIKVTGETQIKGWAQDMRVVSSDLTGANLYIVSEDYGWSYGEWDLGGYYGGGGVAVASPCMGCGGGGGSSASKVIISSISLANNSATLVGTKEYPGYSGAFNVQTNAILLAHDGHDASGQPTGQAELDYIDITDPGGAILPKGSIQVNGLLEGWSADNGRWNIDFDGKKASALTCAGTSYGYCNGQSGYNLSTVDFTDPNAPKALGQLAIASQGWAATARFANSRMYLSPSEGYYTADGSTATSPIQIFDLTDMTAPKLAGQTSITGAVWLFMPLDATRVFALGNDYGPGYSSNKVSVRYLDVTDATQPKVIGESTFGDGWAWTPAADTFKAFVRDSTSSTIAIPFSSWSEDSYSYMNGVQLVSYDTGTITTRGAARSKGWVERGIFVKGRVISLSDQSLSVVDYSDENNPKVVNELTLARNVISAQPQGATIAQLSTDWYGYDQSTSELRVLAIANAEEAKDDPATKSVTINGTDAQIFRNGDLAYVVTNKYPRTKDGDSSYVGPTPSIQVVDLSGGNAVLRGTIDLPAESYSWGWWGGYYYYDWYDGSNIAQVGGNALAFRRVRSDYNQYTGKSTVESKIMLVDITNPDAPTMTSTEITPDEDSWWGNMRVVGNTLYTTHYEWLEKPDYSKPAVSGAPAIQYYVKYYLDQVDLSNRAAPKVGKRINVPGILVGASETDASMLYFVDYRWYGTDEKDEFAVAKIDGDKAVLQSSTLMDGWLGNVFVRGNTAFASVQDYVPSTDPNTSGKTFVKLHQIDLSNPSAPADYASAPAAGWGWLVDVQGDRAIVTSGWGQVGLDLYKLVPGAAPTYDQFARTRGYWSNSMARQGDDLYVSSGYWGVQHIGLK